MNFSPSLFDLSMYPQLLHSVLEYLGLTLITTFPCFAAKYSIFRIKSPQLASEIARFNPFFLDCPFLRNLPVFSSVFTLHQPIIPEIFKFSRINCVNIARHNFIRNFPLMCLTFVTNLLMKTPYYFNCLLALFTSID